MKVKSTGEIITMNMKTTAVNVILLDPSFVALHFKIWQLVKHEHLSWASLEIAVTNPCVKPFYTT